MAEGRRGLGRGLSALLEDVQSATTPEGRRAAGVQEIPIEMIQRNLEQPRKNFSEPELEELTASIRERGVLQPILLRPLSEPAGQYQIVAGERRWRAAQRAGLRTIPGLVRELSDLEVMEIALIENIQRADLNALEEGRAYAAMMERFPRNAEQIASVVGKSRAHVANTLRLMRLPREVQDHLEAGRISAGHARAILDLDDAAAVADRIIRRGLNVRQTEALVRTARGRPAKTQPARPSSRSKDADTLALESDLSEVLGLAVAIEDDQGVGEIRIRYSSLEQLDDVCRRLTRAG
jgi:ParB family chromosome partitioning protein